MAVDPPASRVAGSFHDASTVTSLRQRNRSVVFTQIVAARETTRAHIARETGLSSASVTNLVGQLMTEGLVEEGGSLSSGGGRPISLIRPRADSAYAIGVDVGERGVAVELFDLSMTPVDREFRGEGRQESPQDIATDLAEALEAIRVRNDAAWERLLGIGLGLPGLVETEPGGEQILYAQSLGWPAVRVSELINTDVPVFAENGAKTLAKAELWFGAARGVGNALVALLGRGSGIAIIADGQLARGAHSSAGEWGHTKVALGGRLCRCGGRGCVEAYVGADAILEAWQAAGGEFPGTGWRAIGELVDASARGDSAAVAVLDEVIEVLGASLGSMINLCNPERVVLGGWVGLRLMETLGPRIEQAIRDNSLSRPAGQFELHATAFGGDTVALGSALMPFEAFINSDHLV